MEAPFIFGKIATDENFTDREQETKVGHQKDKYVFPAFQTT